MDTKISILFYGKTAKTTKDNLLPIYLCVTINGKRFETSTHRHITPSKWSVEAFRFFHHYSAKGWQLGRTRMQDWQAVARKWMINGINENGYASCQRNLAAEPAPGFGGEAKDYSEPL